MELNINLNNQRNLKKGKKTFRILAVITIALSIATAIGLFFESTILLWFYVFYFLLLAISFYMQSGGKHLFDLIGKSYFKLTEEGVEYKLDMFNKKIHSFKWKDVEFISIKLFEIFNCFIKFSFSQKTNSRIIIGQVAGLCHAVFT